MKLIVEQTNLYQQQCQAKGLNHLPWSALTVPEFKTWLGLLLSMGIVQKAGRIAEYWSLHAATATPHFGLTMSARRFSQIMRFLHFVNNEDPTVDKSQKTFKIQHVVDYLCRRFREVYVPEREVAIDETMLKAKGRFMCKQFVKIKPIKWGIKLFTLAESKTGYVLNILPYSGKRPDTEYSKTTQTVLDVARYSLNKGHRFFMDNYYMSVELVKVLSENLTLCCGTINAARKGLPKDISKKCPAVKKLKRGESLKRMKDDMLVVTWQDTRPVNLISNIPGKLHDTPCTRRDKKTGEQIVIPRPDAIQDYNNFMGGVDLSDQRVGTYRRHMKSLTWYLQIFFHMFHLSVVQSFILYKKLHPDGKSTQRKFTLNLIDELIGGRTYLSKRGRPNVTPARHSASRFNRELEHAPELQTTQSKCAVHQQRVDTKYSCRACKVRMCPDPCFYRYHYMKDYEFDDPKKANAAPARKKKRV